MQKKVLFAVASSVLLLMTETHFALAANPVAWYHFDDYEAGHVTSSADCFANAAGSAVSPAVPFKQDAPSWPTVEAFPHDCSIYDPVSGLMFRNTTTLKVQHQAPGGYLGSGVRIPDSSAIHLKNFTLEFFIAPCRVTERQWGDYIFRNGFLQIYRAAERSNFHWIQLRDTVKGFRDIRGGDSVWLTHGFDLVHVDEAHSNLWYHIAVTADSVNKKSKLYVNYTLVSTQNLYGEVDCAPTDDAYLGAYTGNGGFDGWIDELRISNGVLEPSQFLRVCSPNALPETTHYLDYTGPTNFMWHSGTFRNGAPTVGSGGLTATFHNSSSRCGTVADCGFGETVRNGLLAGSDAEAPADAVLQLVTNTTSATSSDSGYMTLTRTSSFKGTDATYEVFLRTAKPYSVGNDADCAMVFYSRTPMWYLCVWRNNGNLVFLKPGSSGGEVVHNVSDEAWHHLAVVFEQGDGADSTIAVYVDHVMRLRTTFATSYMSPSGDMGPLYVGDCDWGAGYKFGDVRFGSLRVTRKALRPHEFLTTHPYEGDTVAWYSFEGGQLDGGVYTNMTGFGTASAFAGGTAAFSRRVPGTELLDAAGNSLRGNASSLAFSGGKVTWPRNPLLERQTTTVEFFARLTSASPGAGLVGLFRSESGTAADVSTDSAVWAVLLGSDGRTPEVHIDNGIGNAVSFPADAALSTSWRHYAVSFEPGAGDTTKVTMYVDGSPVGGESVSGQLLLPAVNGGGIPMLGAVGGVEGNPLNGLIDEVRMTARVLSSADFMRVPPPRGMTITIK